MTEDVLCLLSKPRQAQVLLKTEYGNTWVQGPAPKPPKDKGLYMINFNKLRTGEVLNTCVRINPAFSDFLYLFAFMNSVFGTPRRPLKLGANHLFVIATNKLGPQNTLRKWAKNYLTNRPDIINKAPYGFLANAKDILHGCPLVLNHSNTGEFLTLIYQKKNILALTEMVNYAYHYLDRPNIIGLYPDRGGLSQHEGIEDHNWFSKTIIITDERNALFNTLRNEFEFKITNGVKSRRDVVDPLAMNMSLLDDEFRHSIWCNYSSFSYSKKYAEGSPQKRNEGHIVRTHLTPSHFHGNIGYAEYF